MATLASKPSLGQRPTQRAGSRGRQPSLRHVKNSTEVLRQRSQKRANQDVTPDGNSEGRKGRHFTVANVGNNGKIYLRPTTKPVHHKTQASPFTVPDKTSHGPAHKDGGTSANIRAQGYSGTWSETQVSQTPTRARSIGRGTQRSMSATRDSLCRRRTISMSTIDGQLGNNSPTPAGFKIIIDQAGTLSKGSEKASLPTLEVPIPHYRLGTPRFSTRGTAFLHSSVYTRNSTNEDLTSSALSSPEFDGLFPVPPGANNPLSVVEQQPHLSTGGHSIRVTPVGPGPRSLALTSSPAVHRTKDPIVPEIYDSLSQNPDDPAIVRYSPGTREITAASPARIIAQVTSASFLDYELLSDFFLTVRAYLSTHDLLAYLLARFEWAINRFDDDGRVIRVRAFAALRHWILNYFPYDFVVDRELRVKFCDRLNTLLREVKSRSGSGPSDLKLILDLKKCWNGRCALYWDRSVLENSGLESSDIHPGGIAGSRDSQLTHPSQLWTKVSESAPAQGDTLSDAEKSAIALNKWFEGIQQAEMNELKGHERHVSSATTRSLPTSPTSDQSIQALSCTLPGAALKKLGIYHGPVVHPVAHPAPTPPSTRRVCPAAPSALANEDAYPPKFGHKRSGSFSDAVRDKRTSLPSINVEQSSQAVEMAQIFQGSLIRGTVIPPGPPYIDVFAPTSPVSEMPDVFDESSEDSEDSESYSSSKLAVPSTPGVRNIFGSIRRALSGKQLGYSSFNVASSDLSIPQMVRPQSSISPVARSRVEEANFEKRRHDISRQNARIDLLCADTIEMFQRALMQASSDDSLRDDNVTPRPNSGQPNSHAISDPQLEVLTRNQSEVTYGSRSIPIVDDTRPEVPVPKVPSEFVVSTSERLARLHEPELRHLQSADTSAGQATKNPQSVSSEVRPSPLARLSNAVAVAERVFTAPVENPKTPDAATLTGVSESEDTKTQEIKGMKSSHRSRPSATTQERSFRSTHSGAQSLRKYASFQSGITRTSSDHNSERVAASVASPHSAKDAFPKPPGRMLRRRPGGDLRANENVHDLESVPRRSRSVGSITTYTESLRGSEYNVHRTGWHAMSQRSSQLPQSAQSAPPESQPSQAIAGKPVSLVRTHSSQPALRPSFEAAVAEFARIPDDEGGDIEATLLKLEGKYQKKSPPLNETTGQAPQAPHVEDFALRREPRSNPNDQPQRQKQEVQKVESEGGVSFPIPPDPQLAQPTKKRQSQIEDKGEGSRSTMTKSLYAESEELMNSAQHLEQGVNSDTIPKQPETNKLTPPIPRPSFSHSDEPASPITNSSNSQEPESEPKFFSRGARCRSSIPTTTDSFLLDEDEFLSDLSSELSEDTIEPDDDFDYPYGSAAQLVRNENRPPKIGYLLGYPTHPPTPPMTQETAKAINSQAKQSQDSRKPPTPDPSPVSMPLDPSAPKPSGSTSFSISTQNLSAHRHIPFILAYDSRTLAEQFTIIERDAVNEINWQDLIDMRWHHSSPSTLNWVDFLRTQDPTGIELVTSRFNLMVKWTLSEIVLTQNMEERALAIIKFIHIAKYARKNHNFALLLQLTIALTSVDCSRLTKTWDLVPPAEKRSLKDLETLVTPIKNFHNLRQEMETVNAEEGCIPVIALYIHDLTYNSQKPSQILNTRDGEPLVNFERYRTTASIVKSLLRLIDASSKYSYQPVEGALDRCLWMASLSDEMIRLKSKELE
ncbi:MAG: hypothetical protein LQ342_001855 [Letrouitia transgressa]|nr:MAG: hypothetical protein LQ342_001855 [Letrouitia transgressa]